MLLHPCGHSQQFAEPVSLSETTDGPSAIVSGDLDGDGDPDVLTVSRNDRKVAWYANHGGGAFGSQQVITSILSAVEPQDAQLADLDEDGDLDVIVSGAREQLSGSIGVLFWLENLGAGDFSLSQHIADGGIYGTGPFSQTHVDAADLDGDGDVDLAADIGGPARVFLNAGNATSFSSSTLSEFSLSCEELLLVDFDQDGAIDILAAETFSVPGPAGTSKFGRVLPFINQGEGAFAPGASPNPLVPEGLNDLAVADFNQDGSLDLALASKESLEWYAGPAIGPVSGGHPVAQGFASVGAIAAADLDSDGDPDLLVSNAPLTGLAWFENLGGGDFASPRTLSSSSFASAVHAADLDASGDLDVLATLAGIDVAAIQLNQGSGIFGPLHELNESVSLPRMARGADLDGDGDQDALFVSFLDGKLGWHENLGSGGFGPQSLISIGSDGPEWTVPGDADGDGDLDVFTASSGDDSVAWFENLGSGAFGARNLLDSSTTHPAFVGWADLNSDGLSDVYFVSSGNFSPIGLPAPGEVAWIRNLGGGVFAPAQVITSALDGASFADAADLDGDGDLDLLVTASISGGVHSIENLGGGSFAAPQSIQPNAPDARSVQAVDLDADGLLDVLFTATGAGRVAWHRNLGGSLFGPEQVLADSLAGVRRAVAGDLDGDGDLDVLAAVADQDRVVWLEAQGAGTFATAEVVFEMPEPIDLWLGDLNEDLAPDLLATSDTTGFAVRTGLSSLVSATPASGASALTTSLQIQTQGVPDVAVTVELAFGDGSISLPALLVGGSAQVDVPPLGFASASDVAANVTVRWNDGLGVQATQPLVGGFTWNVPQIVGVTPEFAPFDETTTVTIELDENVLGSGVGSARFGDAPPQQAAFSSASGVTLVTTQAPPQPAPGDYPIELELTATGLTEYSRVESRALIYTAPGIVSVEPSSGQQKGGDLITVELMGFVPGSPVDLTLAGVAFSATPTGDLASSTVQFSTPAAVTPGPVDLTATQTQPGGEVLFVSSPGVFEFLPPEILVLLPEQGPQAGNGQINGVATGFDTGPCTIELGGISLPGFISPSGSFTLKAPAAAAPGLADLRLTQGNLIAERAEAYEYLAPTLDAVSPSNLSWYAGSTLVLSGSNFALGVVAQVSIDGEAPLDAAFVTGNQITLNVPAQGIEGSGPVNIVVTQNGVDASLLGEFKVLPSLEVALSGGAQAGGTVDLTVQAEQGGTAYLLIANSISQTPIEIPGVHGAFRLDPLTYTILGIQPLQSTPTLQVAIPAGVLPPGTITALQGLAVEFGPQGNFAGFTQPVPVTIP